MRYKIEAIMGGKIVREYYYPDLTHPKQAGRISMEKIGNKLDYYILIIANEDGEVWQMSARHMHGQSELRTKMKYGRIMNLDQIDMVFSKNMTIYGGVIQ